MRNILDYDFSSKLFIDFVIEMTSCLLTKYFWLRKHLNSLCSVHFLINNKILENSRSLQHVKFHAYLITLHSSRSYCSADRRLVLISRHRVELKTKSNLTKIIKSLSSCFLMSLLNFAYPVGNDWPNSQLYNIHICSIFQYSTHVRNN